MKASGFEKSIFWRMKLRLQFSGWLQYLPNAVVSALAFALAGIGWLIGYWPTLLVGLPLVVGTLLLAVFVFDVVTIKFGLRPTEALPNPKTDLDTFDLMRARRSCRSFQARDLTPEHLDELMKAVRRYGQATHQLGDKPIRFEYIAAPLTVWPVVGAHEFLIAIAPRTYDRLAVIDVGRSLQKIVLHATRMGLGTCWIGPGADQRSIVAHLGDRFDPERDHVVCVCAIGYASRLVPLTIRGIGLLQHRRLRLSELFFASPLFDAPLDTDKEPFVSYGRCYEACQWSPSSYNGQTTRCAAVMAPTDGEQQLTRFDFNAATNSRFYAPVALGIWLADWETGCEALGQDGHLSVLSPQERDVDNAPELPRYDVSWVVDQSARRRDTRL